MARKAGQNSKEQTTEHGDGDGECENAAVHFEIEKNLVLLRGNEPNEQSAAPSREKDSENRADTREHDAFRKNLPNQTGSRGSQGQAHCNFFLPRRGTREQQAGYIRAGNQQNKTDDKHKNFERVSVLFPQTVNAARACVSG